MNAAYDQALAELREATVAVFASELDLIEAAGNARDAGATTEDLRAALDRILSGRTKALDVILKDLGLA